MNDISFLSAPFFQTKDDHLFVFSKRCSQPLLVRELDCSAG